MLFWKVTQPPQLWMLLLSLLLNFYHFPCRILALSWGFTRVLFGETCFLCLSTHVPPTHSPTYATSTKINTYDLLTIWVTHSSVVRASYWYLEGCGFDSCEGFGFFFFLSTGINTRVTKNYLPCLFVLVKLLASCFDWGLFTPSSSHMFPHKWGTVKFRK